MVKGHDGRDRIEGCKSRRLLDRLPGQPRVVRRVWIHTVRVEARFGETIDQPAIPAAKVEHPRARRKGCSDNRIELPPPPIVGHLRDLTGASDVVSRSEGPSPGCVHGTTCAGMEADLALHAEPQPERGTAVVAADCPS